MEFVAPSRRARRPMPDEGAHPSDKVRAALPSGRVTWRHGTKGVLAGRFAAVRVREGLYGATTGTCRAKRRGWSAGDAPAGEPKYVLSSLKPRTLLRALEAAIKAAPARVTTCGNCASPRTVGWEAGNADLSFGSVLAF